MSNGINKQISTGVGIAVIVTAAIIVGGVIWLTQDPVQNTVSVSIEKAETNNQQVPAQKAKDQSCVNSGGTIATALCCGQTKDFSNNCATGACGCAPTSSHQVKICQCGEGKCFDGNSCVQSSRAKTGDSGGLGSQGGAKQCTMEAKLCPDGTSVGKTGPNCEFAPCP